MSTYAEQLAAFTGLPLSDLLDNPPDNVVAVTCRACCGELTPQGFVTRYGRDLTLLRCLDCNGLHGRLTSDDARDAIGIGRPMLTNCASPRYFDIEVDGRRIHGWYDPAACRVIQYG